MPVRTPGPIGPPRGSDRLAALLYSEVSVTGVTTLTANAFGKMHNVTGTTYTITLPAAANNAGKFIGFRFLTTSYGIITLDGNASETIAGELTRKYTQYEWCVLYCDGSNWHVAEEYSLTPSFSAKRDGSNQTGIATATNTKLEFNAEDWDTHSWFDSATNYRYTPLAPGKYMFTASAEIVTSLADGAEVMVMLYKNGASARQGVRHVNGAAAIASGIASAVIDMNGTTDYVEAYIRHTNGSNRDVIGSSAAPTFFQGWRISR